MLYQCKLATRRKMPNARDIEPNTRLFISVCLWECEGYTAFQTLCFVEKGSKSQGAALEAAATPTMLG